MSGNSTNIRISKLARINEQLGGIRFEAVPDEDSSDWVIRFGVVKIVHSLREEEAKAIVEILNKSYESGVEEIVYKNAVEISDLISSLSNGSAPQQNPVSEK